MVSGEASESDDDDDEINAIPFQKPLYSPGITPLQGKERV